MEFQSTNDFQFQSTKDFQFQSRYFWFHKHIRHNCWSECSRFCSSDWSSSFVLWPAVSLALLIADKLVSLATVTTPHTAPPTVVTTSMTTSQNFTPYPTQSTLQQAPPPSYKDTAAFSAPYPAPYPPQP